MVPAREDLQMTDGVSQAISVNAGPELQRQCNLHVQEHGNLKVS